MVETHSPKNNWEDKIYYIPVYTVADAARYLHIPVPTLNSWLKGRSYTTVSGKREFAPLIDRPHPALPQLSFINLIEAHVLRVIREDHHIPLKNVRVALDYISEQFQTDHPLVTKQFRTDGVSLFLDHLGDLVNASQRGQLGIRAILKNLLNRVEWGERDIVSKLFPYIDKNIQDDDSKLITIDPGISFGQPTITGTGIPTKVIADLYKAGDTLEFIADEYSCCIDTVKKVIEFESRLHKKAA